MFLNIGNKFFNSYFFNLFYTDKEKKLIYTVIWNCNDFYGSNKYGILTYKINSLGANQCDEINFSVKCKSSLTLNLMKPFKV